MKLAVAYSKRSAVKGVLKIKVTITKMMFSYNNLLLDVLLHIERKKYFNIKNEES